MVECVQMRHVPRPRPDYTGQRFGKLLVLGEAPDSHSVCGGVSITRRKVRVLCDWCGEEKILQLEGLLRGTTQSCGCQRMIHARIGTAAFWRAHPDHNQNRFRSLKPRSAAMPPPDRSAALRPPPRLAAAPPPRIIIPAIDHWARAREEAFWRNQGELAIRAEMERRLRRAGLLDDRLPQVS